MAVMVRRVTSCLLALALLTSTLRWPTQVAAHWDAPGPPPLRRHAYLQSVSLPTDQDDGVDGNAELLVTLVVVHADHGSATTEFRNTGYNFDDQLPWLVEREIWQHEDCTPANAITVVAHTVELDVELTEAVLIGIASAVAGAVIGPVLGVGVLAGAIIGGTTSFVVSLPAFNGTDDLGNQGMGSAGDGTFLLETSGEDGTARHVIQLQTLPQPDERQCGGPASPPQTVLTPEVRTGRIYTPLEGALGAVSQVTTESGNPAGLTPGQLADLRSTLSSATIGVAKLFAAAEIEDARRFQGVERAIADYILAKQMVEGSDPAGALRFFRSAFLNAAAATARKAPDADHPLPFHVALGTDFFSTRPNRRLEVPALILGATGPPVLGASVLPHLAITGVPSGLNVEVVREPGSDSAFRLRFDIGRVAPGRYTLGIQASDGRNAFVHPFTLAVNAAPQANEPRIAGLFNAASLRTGAVAPNSYVSLFGSGLSPAAASAEPPAQSLGGTTVTVQDRSRVARSAGLVFGSPSQFNFVVPAGTAPGPAVVTLRRQDGRSHRALLDIEDPAPGLFSANGDGRGVAAAVVLRVSPDGSQTSQLAFTRGPDGRQVPLPIDIGEDPVYLLLFGTGIRGVRGLPAELRAGGINVPVLFAGPQGTFEALDQVNAGPLPAALRGRGEVELMLSVGGKPANPVTIAVR